MPLNADRENARIEKFIGSPVDVFDSGDDQLCVNIYNYFKPAILQFFYLANNPYRDDHRDKILTLMHDFATSFGEDFLADAAAKGVIPQDAFDDDDWDINGWTERWFDDIFPDEPGLTEYELSVVVQGGEAVNYYTQYKYNNVPTHDTDTRILAGRHFNYTKRLQDINPTAKEYMHKYRFFLVYCLMSAVDMFHDANVVQAGIPIPDQIPYIERFLPNWQNITFGYDIVFSANDDFEDLFSDGVYDMTQDYYLERLLSLDVSVMEEVEDGERVTECSIVDLFCPYKRLPTERPIHRVGQSDNIFSYFGTEQANNLLRAIPDPAGGPPNQPVLNENGHVPSQDLELILPQGIGPIAGLQIDVRLLPLGYTLFETIRMLLVSEVLQRHHLPHKLMKYKQKLNVLLGSLMNETLTEFVFQQTLTRKAKNADMQLVLSGGGNEIETNRKLETNTPNMLSPELIREARNYSKQLKIAENNRIQSLNTGSPSSAVGEELIEEEEQDFESMSEAQRLGYMDFMSYQHPDFKDYRLPRDPEEIRQRFEKAVKKSKGNNVKKMQAQVPSKKKGGYRKRTPRKRHSKARNTTRRK